MKRYCVSATIHVSSPVFAESPDDAQRMYAEMLFHQLCIPVDPDDIEIKVEVDDWDET